MEYNQRDRFRTKQLQEHLKIVAHTPRDMTPGLHYDFFREIHEKYNPTRFVIDGLGALERHYEREEFLEAARNFALLSKARG